MPHINALTIEEFTERVNKANPQLKIIGEFHRQRDKILVEDQYGLLNVQAQSLYVSKPTIECAIDKTSYWINKAKEIRGDVYDYSKTIYVGGHKRLTITCRKCGDFDQKATDHLQGRGCPKCADVGACRKSFQSFIDKSIERNGDIYEFREIDFPFKRLGKVEVTCKECRNIFETKPAHILGKRTSCGVCTGRGVDPESEGYIYQLVYDNELIPYVGLTTRLLSTRLSAHRETVIKQRNSTKLTEYLTGKDMRLLTIMELDRGKAHELAEKEGYWIDILGTKWPNGLNKGGAGTGLSLKYISSPLLQPQLIPLPL